MSHSAAPHPASQKLQKQRPVHHHATTLPNGAPRPNPIAPPLPTVALPSSLSPGARPRSISLHRPGDYFMDSAPPPPLPMHQPNSIEHTMRAPMINPATRPYSDVNPTIAFPMPQLPADPGYLPPRAPSGPYGPPYHGSPAPVNLYSRPPYPHHSNSDPTSAMSPTTAGKLFDQELEQEQMRQALELSRREEAQAREREKAQIDEANQLALALAESLRDSGKQKAEDEDEWEEYDPSQFTSTPTDGPSTMPLANSDSSSISTLSSVSTVPDSRPTTASSSSRPLPINDDEALARRIALDGFQKERYLRDSKLMPPMTSPEESSFPLPTYNEVLAAGPSRPPPTGPPVASGSSHAPHLPRSTSAHAISPTSPPPLLRPHSQSVGGGAIASNLPPRPHTAYASSTPSSSSMPMGRSDSIFSLDSESVSESHESSSAHLGKQLTDGTQVIEEDLARGVSIAFSHPPIQSPGYTPTGPFPNIISLPYGRCPPLHIMATSWRHLLQLMARLGETRIEPTIEAIAQHKQAIPLRCVIQFARPSPSSDEWKTILYLTADVAVPKNHPQPWRFNPTNVNQVPYSYTLTKVVSVGGPDSEVSKSFMVPPHPNTPYPTLPISLPNLARYLQEVLKVSRRATGDKTSGLGKLAKVMDTCYPSEAAVNGVEGGDEEERSRLNVFKRLIGRGGREARAQGVNDETYDLVTPFRLDDFQ